MKFLKPLFAIVVLGLIVLQPNYINAKVQTYPVIKVVDGDTLDVKINGKTERLRLIGVDTPETVDPRKPVQCFGKEASAKAKVLLLGKSVVLTGDPTQGERDKYGRLLRYVTLPDGRSFNELMIKEGYAFEYTYNIPYKYQSKYKQLQSEARQKKRGLWADTACKGKATSIVTTAKPKATTTVKPTTTKSTAQPAVKKSVNSICHAKGTRYYDQTKTFTSYSTVKACVASGGKLPK